MKTVWREYGVIATLLVVAVGGYLYMSRSPVDLLNMSLDTIGDHLLALVPDASGRRDVEAALDTLHRRVEEGDVDPEQLERFAASVFNIGSTGEALAPDEAEMVVRMAYSDQEILPSPKEGSRTGTPPPRQKKLAAPEDLAELGIRLQPMVAFYESVRSEAGADSTGHPVRFYSDGNLRVVVDDRMREKVEVQIQAQALMAERAVSWRAHLAEAAEAERQRYMERAEELKVIADTWSDQPDLHPKAAILARLNKLRSLGLVSGEHVDSVVVIVESELESLIRQLPPPPPRPPKAESGNPPSSTSSSSGSSTGR